MLTAEQEKALERVAEAFGWDHMPVQDVGLILWSAFHYYVKRLPELLSESSARLQLVKGGKGHARTI